ncbi:MAG: ribonuclease R [Rhodospirillaceae bacterium]|nr:ribonuclease R [Rhodospirillaceae bacterium]MBT3493468.1 ribonuclease R [Rhodospirillaceae bacterium]MBT3778982.1 ribonuclease R [Rhodospirillaceae bacterium]MBT3976807.1 ribonuclease R [Rhodospirillaceae bacterium]MBT4167162.1 ribonuclease R [Rhodospirillaceae bacterium]
MSAPRGLPDKAAIKKFITDAPGSVGRREIARAFGIKGAERVELRAILKELADEGVIGRGKGKRYNEAGALPPVAVLRISGVDDNAMLLAEPMPKADDNTNPDDIPKPRIRINSDKREAASLGIGDRILARLTRKGAGYEASIIRVLPKGPERVIGVYSEVPGQGARIRPTDRRQKSDYTVEKGQNGGAKRGDLVVADVLIGRRHGLREARVVEVLGDMDDRRAISLIAIHSNDIPDVFPAEAVAQAEAAQPVVMSAASKREDLRHLPLITVDGADARDFDDAIWAAPDDDPKNKGGWQIIVAIADVSHYVTFNSALDREARRRGNSVYFPDRVVPMLPEALSNNLCSLRPDEDRPVLAVTMRLDAKGRRLEHKFHRAMIRSAARVIYEDLQAAHDGEPNEQTGPILDTVIEPLYGAWGALMRARESRQPLDLDLPEMKISVGEDGHVEDVRQRQRLDAHRVIEEFMIEANVAAAETLEAQKMPCVYRVHDQPDREKLLGLKDFLSSLGLSFAMGERLRPELFNRILAKAKGSDHWEAVNQSILRSQSQARYDPDNIGHFGLSRPRYAHFTSPIRRYSDLLVHRALIRGGGFGKDGLHDEEAAHLAETAEHISNTERRAMVAERDANDRYMAAFMAEQTGAEFIARINGVTRAGLFLTLVDTGADGLLPMRYLHNDYYQVDEAQKALIGERSGVRYRLGDSVTVRLVEVNTLTGGLIFELPSMSAETTEGAYGHPRIGKPRKERVKRGSDHKHSKHGKRKGRRRPK